MSDSNAMELIKVSDRLYDKRHTLLNLWQELAWQFYPERADFTTLRVEGLEFADHMFESIPAQFRRDLASALGAILRPRSRAWFKLQDQSVHPGDVEAQVWLSEMTDITRAHLYSTFAGFQRAMREADNDFVSFGNAVTSITENHERNGLYFRTWHLRDCAWTDNSIGDVDYVARKLKVTLRKKLQLFGDEKLSKQEKDKLAKNPFEEVEIRHVCMPREDYDPYTKGSNLKGKPYISIYFCPTTKKVLREGGYKYFPYHVRRWATTSSSPYGHSPASMLGLVDARLLQSQAQVILEAAEKVVDPPVIATRDAVIEGPNLGAGQVSWVDADYDEKLGVALRPFESRGNIPIGLQMKQDTRQVLSAAFFLNKLNLPIDGPEMSATEVNARIEEYIRGAGPVFEPFENDNARLLDTSFEMLMEMGAYGSIHEIPKALQGKEIKFEFDTPIQIAYTRKRVSEAMEIARVVGEMAKIEPGARHVINLDNMARDTGLAIAAVDGWFNSAEDIARAKERDMQMQMLAQAKPSAQAMKAALESVPNIETAAMSLRRLNENTDGSVDTAAELAEENLPTMDF